MDKITVNNLIPFPFALPGVVVVIIGVDVSTSGFLLELVELDVSVD
jgi:hypothetical protein